MITIYVYTHDTMADWEIGHVTAELHSGRFSSRTHRRYRSKQLASPRNRSRAWAG